MSGRSAHMSNEDCLPSVVVVIVNYRSADAVARLLGDPWLLRQHIVLVDNCSEPSRVAQIGAAVGATVLLNDTNDGFAKAVNAAIRSIPCRHLPILLINPDVLICGDAIAALVGRLQELEADAVAPLLLNTSGRVQVGAAGGTATLLGVIYYFLFLSYLVPWLRGIFWTRRQLMRGGPADWLCMACMLFSPTAFDQYGPLPEWEFLYAEDVAWGTRASRAGARLVLVADIQVQHEQGASGGAALWSDALGRLLRRELGQGPGWFANVFMHLGLTMRGAMKRVRGIFDLSAVSHRRASR